MHYQREDALRALADNFFGTVGNQPIMTQAGAVFTLEELYQAIKARLQVELAAKGHSNEGVVYARLDTR